MRLYTSNRAEHLVDQLSDVLRQPSGGPFDPEVVLVHSPGMSAWIRQRVARRLGICAHVEFPFPSHFLPKLFQQVLGDEANASDKWTRSRIRWAIFAALEAYVGDPDFESVEGYLVDDTGEQAALKRLQLSDRIARAFNGYLYHRPEMIEVWQHGGLVDETSVSERWQAKLWCDVRDRIGAGNIVELSRAFSDAVTHPPAVVPAPSQPLDQLTLPLFGAPASTTEPPPSKLPKRLCLFGVSSLPPLQLALISTISSVVEVHAFVLSPSREFFADIRDRRTIARREAQTGERPEDAYLEVGNPLLASLGKLGRDFQHLLYGTNIQFETFVEAFDDPIEDEAAASGQLQPDMFPAVPTALAFLQSDVLNLRHRGDPRAQPGEQVFPAALHEDDRSLAIHACHGAMRQVEVLHDQLLDLFRRDESLSPADVIVMCPDLETFGPLVEAVFSREKDDRRDVPFRIADRSLRRDSPVAEGLLATLSLLDSRFAAPDVVDLLAMPVVHRRFGIAGDALPNIVEWVRNSGIRWGIDAEHRTTHGQPPYAENTWRFGLDRMLIGMALPGEGRKLYAGVLPFDPIEGHDARVVGQLAAFCDTLFSAAVALQAPRSLAEWVEGIDALLSAMVAMDDDTSWEHEQIRRMLQEAAEEATDVGADTPISLAAVRSWLHAQLTEGRSPYGFLTGSVTFCEMLPMRAIPFRVVCMLGMDERAFPRSPGRLGFDLIAQSPARGDRNTRDDDRYLFLEALLSARDRVVITFTGLSARDNAKLPPSVLVAELIDVCVESFGVGVERFVTEHALQPFSERYFRADDPLFTYAHEFAAGAESMRLSLQEQRPFLSRRAPLEAPITAITVTDFVRFFRHPVRAFFNKRLQIYLGEDDNTLAAREPVLLDRLQSSILAGRMLEREVSGGSEDGSYQVERAGGSLPIGEPGAVTHDTVAKRVAPLDAAIAAVRGIHDPESVAVALDVDGVEIAGRIPGVFDGKLVVHQYARVRGDHELVVWVQHLLLCAALGPRESTLIGRPGRHSASAQFGSRGRDVLVITYEPPADPMAELRRLVALYTAGMEEPLMLFPKTSYVYRMTDEQGSKWRDAWSPWGFAGEAEDPYNHAFARGEGVFHWKDPIDPRVFGNLPSDRRLTPKMLSREVFGPLFQHRDAK